MSFSVYVWFDAVWLQASEYEVLVQYDRQSKALKTTKNSYFLLLIWWQHRTYDMGVKIMLAPLY